VEGAPKTRFLSLELDFGELGGLEDPALMGKNAMSLNMLHDTNGAFQETELIVAYASRVRIPDRHNLRLGAGVNYLAVRLDGNALTVEQSQDLSIGQYLGSYGNMQLLDFNLGLAPMKIIISPMACTMSTGEDWPKVIILWMAILYL
jgi:hypothetical protein